MKVFTNGPIKKAKEGFMTSENNLNRFWLYDRKLVVFSLGMFGLQRARGAPFDLYTRTTAYRSITYE